MKSTSGCKLLVHLWLDHPGQVIRPDLTSLHFTWLDRLMFISLTWMRTDDSTHSAWSSLTWSSCSRPARRRRRGRRRRREAARPCPLSTSSPSESWWCVVGRFSIKMLLVPSLFYVYFFIFFYILLLLRQLCTTASPTLCVALCQTPTRSLERWENIIIIIMI